MTKKEELANIAKENEELRNHISETKDYKKAYNKACKSAFGEVAKKDPFDTNGTFNGLRSFVDKRIVLSALILKNQIKTNVKLDKYVRSFRKGIAANSSRAIFLQDDEIKKVSND